MCHSNTIPDEKAFDKKSTVTRQTQHQRNANARLEYFSYLCTKQSETYMRKKIIAGNWKMNCDADQAVQLMKNIHAPANEAVQVMVFPPFLYLDRIVQMQCDNIITGAQNVARHNNGAYTGEISATMLLSIGIRHALIGHSERREYFGETNQILKDKLDLCLHHGLNVIFCCGEPLEVRQAETQVYYVIQQLRESVGHLGKEQMKQISIAYEPIWAIGTGVNASAQQAQEMHENIRGFVATNWDEQTAESVHILYGGSLKADNAAELFSMPDIDGGLIGGASLKANEFNSIIELATQQIKQQGLT